MPTGDAAWPRCCCSGLWPTHAPPRAGKSSCCPTSVTAMTAPMTYIALWALLQRQWASVCTWIPSGRGAQAGQVGGEQAAARRIPVRIWPPRLGEHGTEYDNLTRGHILPDGAVRPPAVDDLPQDPVDLLANGTGLR